MKPVTRAFVLAGVAIALVLGAGLSLFASSAPDGLEKVAADHGFLQQSGSRAVWHWALMPGYGIPGVANESLATAVAGLCGTLAVLICGYVLARLLRAARAAKRISE